jgi:hypothetical protein
MVFNGRIILQVIVQAGTELVILFLISTHLFPSPTDFPSWERKSLTMVKCSTTIPKSSAN